MRILICSSDYDSDRFGQVLQNIELLQRPNPVWCYGGGQPRRHAQAGYSGHLKACRPAVIDYHAADMMLTEACVPRNNQVFEHRHLTVSSVL